VTAATQTDAIGSFAIQAPAPLDDPRLSPLRAFRVAGDPTGPMANRRGLAYALPLLGADETRINQIRARVDRRVHLAGTGIAPAFEGGLADGYVFVVEVEPAGERLADLLARRGRLTPFDALALTHRVASALEAANFAHGQLSSTLVWVDGDAIALSGFAFDEPDSGADATGLAGLVFEMLSGRRFTPSDFSAPAASRVERIREAMPGISAALAHVVANGTAGAHATVDDLIRALDAARDESIVLLAEAAHESISLKDLAGANVFLDVARGYDREHQAIKTVEARLTAGAKPAPAAQIAAREESTPFDVDHDYAPGSEQAKFLESLRAAIPESASASAKKPLPWVAIAAGAVGVFAILAVLTLALAQSH
jgi:hypothetical protein